MFLSTVEELAVVLHILRDEKIPIIISVWKPEGIIGGCVVGYLDGYSAVAEHVVLRPEYRSFASVRALHREWEADVASIGCTRTLMPVKKDPPELLVLAERLGFLPYSEDDTNTWVQKGVFDGKEQAAPAST